MAIILLPPTGEDNVDPRLSPTTLIIFSSSLMAAIFILAATRFFLLKKHQGKGGNARQKVIGGIYYLSVLTSFLAFLSTIGTLVAEMKMGASREVLTSMVNEKLIWACTLLYNLTLYFIKFAFIVFYMESFKGVSGLWVHRSLWTSLVIVVMLFFASTYVLIFGCWSMSYSWNPLSDINHSCAVISTAGIVHILCSMNALGDLAVVATPIRFLGWMYARTSRREFIVAATTLVFFGSSAIVSITRLVVLENIYQNRYDAIWKGWHAVVMLTHLEVFVALFAFTMLTASGVWTEVRRRRLEKKMTARGVELAEMGTVGRASRRSNVPMIVM